MIEQKYYVKMPHVFVEHIFTDLFLDTDYTNSGYCFKQAWITAKQMFTKAELAKIMAGALYRCHEINMDCVALGCKEWINPLIELIPVEEEDV